MWRVSAVLGKVIGRMFWGRGYTLKESVNQHLLQKLARTSHLLVILDVYLAAD